jgi:transcriptional regulator with XRE-family HTH domain
MTTLKALRMARRLTLNDVADLTGFAFSRIALIERKPPPKISQRLKNSLGSAFNVPIEKLLSPVDEQALLR